MSPPFRLVPDNISSDTVHALEELLADARAGQLIGIAFIGWYRHRQFITNTAGEARRDPSRTLGMVGALSHQLGERLVKGG